MSLLSPLLAVTRRSLAGVTVLMTAAAAGPVFLSPASANEVRIQGATTFYERVLAPNLARIEELAGAKLSVVPNKSIWGLIALLERRTDLAMISADISGEIDVARRTSPDLPYGDLKVYDVAQSRISFAVHPENPVRSLTNAQIAAMLRGEITNWRDLGGPDLPVRIVATQDGGGTVVAVRAQLLGGAPISAPGAIRPESARHVVQVVAQERGALGIAQLGLVKKAGLPEITSERAITQNLSFVVIGPATGPIEAVIEATRKVASENPL